MARFIVNAGGVVHIVHDETFPALLISHAGTMREATSEEIAAWHEAHNPHRPQPETKTTVVTIDAQDKRTTSNGR